MRSFMRCLVSLKLVVNHIVSCSGGTARLVACAACAARCVCCVARALRCESGCV